MFEMISCPFFGLRKTKQNKRGRGQNEGSKLWQDLAEFRRERRPRRPVNFNEFTIQRGAPGFTGMSLYMSTRVRTH